MESKDNVSHIRLFGRSIPTGEREATAEEATQIKQWLRKAFESNPLSDDARSDECTSEGKIEIHLINYPVKESPMVIRAVGKNL
jgi:hypothetical protein